MSVVSCSTTSTTAYKVTADTTGTLVLQTGSTPTTAATIDASQNMGLGVTPSAWRSIQKSLDIGVAASVTGFTALPYLRSYANAYINSGGSAIYKINGEAGAYTIDGNVHAWFNAASGTAGNPISFTQAMTLDSNGRLSLTTANPDTTGIIVQATTTTNAAAMAFINQSGVNKFYVGLDSSTGNRIGSLPYAGSMWHEGAYSLQFGTSNTLRATIDSSGNFNLNTTGAFGKFCADIGAFAFTAGASGSSLSWGTSSTSGRPCITVASTGTGQDSAFRTVVSPDNGSSWQGWTNGVNIETGSNTLSWCINGNNNTSRVFSSGGVAMRLTTGGALSTVTGSLGTISDIRMKKDVVDATPKLDQLMQLRVVNYVLIDDPEERKMLGFVAQEVEQVFAGLIEEHDILDPDTKEVTMQQKTVKTTVLIPMLVKAMQEQQAIIETLTNRITALENK